MAELSQDSTVLAAVRQAADQPSIDRLLRAAVETGQVPGIVALAATEDRTIYQGAFGTRGLASGGGDLTPDSVFWIASMTKAITAAAALQLVERGELALDRPIADTLPELAAPEVLDGFDGAGAPILRPARRPITLRHLLTHTAGFTYDIWNADTGRHNAFAGLPGIISCQHAALRTPLAFDPGERWEYGINIDWAGQAVERASGQPLGTYLQDNLLGPLGMADTSFKLAPSQRGRLVAMHARQPDGALMPMAFELPQDPEFHMGGGGLYSTAPDYMKFCQMILHDGRAQNGEQVLSPATVALMRENQMADLNVVELKTAIPGSSLDAEFFPGMVKKWSAAFMINTEASPAGRSAGSLAWAGLGNTYFWIDPAQRVAGVILTQILPFADPAVLDLLSRFESATYAAVRAA